MAQIVIFGGVTLSHRHRDVIPIEIVSLDLHAFNIWTDVVELLLEVFSEEAAAMAVFCLLFSNLARVKVMAVDGRNYLPVLRENYLQIADVLGFRASPRDLDGNGSLLSAELEVLRLVRHERDVISLGDTVELGRS